MPTSGTIESSYFRGVPLPTGTAQLRNLVPDLPVISAQKSLDLDYRKAAHQQIAQLGQHRIESLAAGVRVQVIGN